MHIPDGYLSPQTYIPLYGAFMVIEALAVKKVRKEVSKRSIPYIGMAAAFSFIIMMLNIPIPGGTTGHAVGAALIAIILGPWSASLAVSVALIIQALVFGDGGITTFGANAFNMAIFMPFVAYFIFRLLNGHSLKKSRIVAASFAAGYLSLVLTAILTGIELGLQPLIAAGPDGRALYAPYDLSIAVPAMALGHLALFGVMEGLVTALVVYYFYRSESQMIYAIKQGGARE
jgi:cobalt/nickel transport system permease protein